MSSRTYRLGPNPDSISGVTINNAQIGFDLVQGSTSSTGNQGVGGEAIIDAVVSNTQTFIRWSGPSNGHLQGSLVLNNIQLTNVPVAVGVTNGATVVRSCFSETALSLTRVVVARGRYQDH